MSLFSALETQWVEGFAGFSGLRYEALPAAFELAQVPVGERREFWAALRIMEREALRCWKAPA